MGNSFAHADNLTPLAAAGKALRAVNTDYLAALWAGPPFLFVFDETSDAGFLYVPEIFNHTHAVLGSVALVQVFQAVARKAVTPEAVPRFASRYPIAGLDSAYHSGLGFCTVVTPAARARILLSHISPAKMAVHAARRD